MEHGPKTGIETRLGVRDIDPDKVLRFPHGLMGFEDKHDFTLLRIREDAPFLLLQSLDDPKLGLLVTDPFSFLKDYTIRLSDAEQHLLGVEDIHQVAVLVTVAIPNGQPQLTTLNLTGPILINHEARVGIQSPQANTDLPTQVYLYQQDS